MAEEAILNYLKTTNRPYSANDIVLNLHKQWGKTGVQKALDALVAAGSVMEKVYGKQKVYVFRQPEEDQTTMDEALKDIDAKIEEHLPTLQQLEDELKATEGVLKGLMSTQTTAEILAEIETVKADIAEMTASLEEISKENTPIDKEVFNELKQQVSKNTKEYRSRKRMCMDMFNAILESYPKSKKALIEDLGIETDEDVNFQLENI